jgi:excisionase family DNA binding protein
MAESVLMPRLVTVEEMAEILNITTQTLYRHMAQGAAPPSLRTGRKILFPLGDVFDEWVRSQAERTPGVPMIDPSI